MGSKEQRAPSEVESQLHIVKSDAKGELIPGKTSIEHVERKQEAHQVEHYLLVVVTAVSSALTATCEAYPMAIQSTLSRQ